MPNVAVKLPHHRYDILIEPGCLERVGEIVADHARHRSCALITDNHVVRLHGERTDASLRKSGFEEVVEACVASGEQHKNIDTVRKLYDAMLERRLERRSPVVALGGGVIGDTAGFVAATYLRGVPFVQAPTTLLAMVDSSVGGKVGVNVPQGKNLIGAFYQPVVVVIDPLVLQTLPERELRCGLAECIKHAVIRDAGLFDYIEENLASVQALEPEVLTELIRRNVAIKAAVVMEDEKESGVRAHLNFGHTFAHAIEATAGYGRIQHGEAVALGMLAAARMAAGLGMCDASPAERLKELLTSVGLPTRESLPPVETLLEAMKLDKKVADHRIRFVLPDRMGNVVVRDDVNGERVADAWASISA